MTGDKYKTAFLAAATAVVLLLFVSAFLYGKAAGKTFPAITSTAPVKTKVLLGRIVRIEPLHISVESDSLGSSRTFDVIVGPRTEFLRLVPWAIGEREKAAQDYAASIHLLNPHSDDTVPPPPLQMKPEPLLLKDLVAGIRIGVLAESDVDPTQPVIARAIRPLTDKESETGQVAITFPLQ